MSERRAPSMYDVADRAGVSHQTVSRVLNGFEGIRPATRERVLAAIREVGYRPNLAARSLVTRRTRAIGVLAPASADFGPVRTLQSVEQAVRAAGWQPLVTSTPIAADAVRDSLEFLLDQSVEALVVIAPYSVLLDEVADRAGALPVVALQTGESADVTVDQVHGVRLAVRHLVELGHRRAQVITGPPEFLEAEVRRDAAHREAAAAGLELGPDLPGDWSADAGYAAAAALDAATTAVLSGNDQMALGLMHGLVDLGRSVPGDVSVVGFDDIPESAHSIPPLTTVHQDFDEVGRRAVARLLAELGAGAAPAAGGVAGGDPIRPELVVRSSTRAVPAG
jgi:DNA-binding LacI/PurR family transcriptional regulator